MTFWPRFFSVVGGGRDMDCLDWAQLLQHIGIQLLQGCFCELVFSFGSKLLQSSLKNESYGCHQHHCQPSKFHELILRLTPDSRVPAKNLGPFLRLS